MKINSPILMLFLFLPSLYAQNTAPPSVSLKWKLTLSYGIYAIDPDDINDHISTSNTLLESTTPTIKSVPEIAATLSLRPLRDTKIILLRGGYMLLKRTYQVTIPETIDTTTVTGNTTGTINETYTSYPFSIGIGLATSDFDTQAQIEFIYGLGYIKEEGSYVTSTGQKISYTRSLFSPAYGFRIGGQTTIRFSENLGLTLELSYRGLVFEEYEDETSTQPTNIKFSYSGINGSVGLSIIF